MTEDYDFAFNIRLIVVNTVPYRVFFLVIVPVHVVVVRCDGAAMHKEIRLAVNLNVDIQRQAVKIIEYLLMRSLLHGIRTGRWSRSTPTKASAELL